MKAFTTNLSSVAIPKNIKESLVVPEWKHAVLEEMRVLKKNVTLADAGCSKRVDTSGLYIGIYCQNTLRMAALRDTKWDWWLKASHKSMELTSRETFAPVAKLNTTRVLLSLAAKLELVFTTARC